MNKKAFDRDKKKKVAKMTSSDTQKCNNNMNLNVYLYFKLRHSKLQLICYRSV
jgi:hypothetical protein